MPFIYEVNGQRVEFDKEPTEQDIDEAAKQLGSQDRKSTRLNSSHSQQSRMPSSA